MTYTTCHTDRFPRENTYAFHPLETRARTAPLAPRAANRPHQDLLRHQAHRGKYRRPRGPLPCGSPPRKSQQALLHRPGPEAAWLEYDEGAVRDLKKLDHQVQREILNFIEKRVGQAEDPRSCGCLAFCFSASCPRFEATLKRRIPPCASPNADPGSSLRL